MEKVHESEGNLHLDAFSDELDLPEFPKPAPAARGGLTAAAELRRRWVHY